MAATTDRKIDSEGAGDDRRAAAQALSRLLADTYTLYLKTHNYTYDMDHTYDIGSPT